jgi:hypothetical protein
MNDQQKKIFEKLKREDCIAFIKKYYSDIGRTETPDYESYSLQELKKCLVLFNIHLAIAEE